MICRFFLQYKFISLVLFIHLFLIKNTKAQGIQTFQAIRSFHPDSPNEYITILPPNNITSYGLTLPAIQGTAGQVLTNDGAGNLSWMTVSGGGGGSSSGWGLQGNVGTDAIFDFIGTTDGQSLVFRTNNVENMRLYPNGNLGIGTTTPLHRLSIEGTTIDEKTIGINGIPALFIPDQTSFTGSLAVGNGLRNLSSGGFGQLNTAIGINALLDNTQGTSNIALGTDALRANTTGEINTALGIAALYANSSGDNNVAIGFQTLYHNTTGSKNIATGSQSLYYNDVGSYNIGIGEQTLHANTAGNNNIAVGEQSLFQNTTGSNNIAMGEQSLYSNTTGEYNIASGKGSLYNNTTGNFNIANGHLSLNNNTTGNSNVSTGHESLHENTTGNFNTAYGVSALNHNTTGNYNTAIGGNSLYGNTTGSNNTATGLYALTANTTGEDNTADGRNALTSNTTGSLNTANGVAALYANTTGNANVALGTSSLAANTEGNKNTAIGRSAFDTNTTGNNNTALGYRAGVTNITTDNNTFVGFEADVLSDGLTNATAIGYNSKVATSNSLVLGATGADAVNVGIGTNSPSQGLEIKNKNILINNDNGTANEIRFAEPSSAGTNYTAFKAQNQAVNITYSLPNADGTSGQLLSTNGSGTLSWATPSSSAWSLTGNSSTNAVTNFIGTTDNVALHFRTNNVEQMRITTTGNIGIGTSSPSYKLALAGTSTIADRTMAINSLPVIYLPDQTTFPDNIALGNGLRSLSNSGGGLSGAGNTATGISALLANTQGFANVATGAGTLQVNTTGNSNTAVGYLALNSNTTGFQNTAIGYQALRVNTTSYNNVALGVTALKSNLTGNYNVGIGNETLEANTTGNNNVALGSQALEKNTTGSYNVATGMYALYNATIADNNVASGFASLQLNTTGNSNVAIGTNAMYINTTGSQNVAIGSLAGSNYNNTGSENGNNIFIGYRSGLGITTGTNNTIIGANVTGLGATLSNNIILADGAGNRRINVDNTGNVGIGTNTPNTKLDVSGAFAIRPLATNITTDNQVVTVGNQSFLKLTSNGISTNRTITLSNGLQEGQQLVIHAIATGANGIELEDSGNLDISGTAQLDSNDTITLIWSNALWIEMYRSSN